jgi:hypothetical protein
MTAEADIQGRRGSIDDPRTWRFCPESGPVWTAERAAASI